MKKHRINGYPIRKINKKRKGSFDNTFFLEDPNY